METPQDLFNAARQAHMAGRGAEAEELYRRRLELVPDCPQTLFFLGRLLQETGRAAQAIALLEDAVARQPKAAGIWEALGQLHDEAGAIEKAIPCFEEAVRLAPELPDAHIELGVCHARLGEASKAVVSFRKALGLSPEDPVIHLNLGQALSETGETEDAARHYQKTIEINPQFTPAFSGLAQLLRRQGRFEEALDYYRRALAIQPKDPGTLNSLASLYKDLGRLEDAVTSYQRSLAIAKHPATFSSLATALERAHRLDEAAEAARQALALAPGQAEARLVLAKLATRRDDSTAAMAGYRALIKDLEAQKPLRQRAILARAQADLAALLEKAGDHPAAFSLFEAANRTNREGHPSWQAESKAYLKRVKSLSAMVSGLEALTWHARPGDNQRSPPVFLIGFPRSGTTLLDQLLNTHSRLVVMEEKTVLDRLSAQLGGPEDGRLARLRGLSEGDLQAMRAHYWDLAGQHCDLGAAEVRLVDKLPLNILNLWLIYGLFPEAKVVLALRDPRDVCLSCFTNLFRLGEGLAGFPTLESAAELYASVMTLWLQSRERLPLEAYQLPYEALIENLEGEARRLVDFLGLPWEDDVLNYRRHARARYIITPSEHQVVQPLYKTSRARLRHYPEAMASVQHHLAPFIEAFGYGDH